MRTEYYEPGAIPTVSRSRDERYLLQHDHSDGADMGLVTDQCLRPPDDTADRPPC